MEGYRNRARDEFFPFIVRGDVQPWINVRLDLIREGRCLRDVARELRPLDVNKFICRA